MIMKKDFQELFRMSQSSIFHFDNTYFSNPLVLDNLVILQAGDLFCNNSTTIVQHRQLCFELSFIVSGHGTFLTNGVASEVHKNQIYISIENDIHNIISDRDNPLRYYYIGFLPNSGSICEKLVQRICEKYRDPENRKLDMASVFTHMSGILSEFTRNDPYKNLLIESYLMQILIQLYRHSESRSYQEKPLDIKSNIIYTVVSYIDTHFLELDSLDELSDIFSFEYSYLSKLFKSVIGRTPQEYLSQKRFEHARLLLIRDNKSVTEIAEILGYSSLHNFSRAFKKYYGQSPQQFRMTQIKELGLEHPEK